MIPTPSTLTRKHLSRRVYDWGAWNFQQAFQQMKNLLLEAEIDAIINVLFAITYIASYLQLEFQGRYETVQQVGGGKQTGKPLRSCPDVAARYLPLSCA